MEIVILGVLGFIGYLWFKGSVISKSLVAGRIQKAFEIVEKTFFISFEGDSNIAAQKYVEQYWEKWQPIIKREKIRPPFIVLMVLREVVVELYNAKDNNFEFLLQALFIAIKDAIFRYKASASASEEAVLDFATSTFEKMMQRTTPVGMEELMGEQK